MSSISWTATTSGTWSSGANWSTGAAPLTGDDVNIVPTSSVTVTYTAGSLAIDSLTTSNTANFAMTGGTLSVKSGYNFADNVTLSAGQLTLTAGNYGANFGGNLTQSGGTLTLFGGEVVRGNFTQSGGTLNIRQGAFTDVSSSTTLAGTIAGGGVLNLAAGTDYFKSGLALNVATLEVTGGTANFSGALTDANNFQLGQSGTLSLNNNTLTLTGANALYGTVTNGGVIAESGKGILNGLQLNNGSALSLTSSSNQTGNITLGGTGAGALNISATGTLRVIGNESILNPANGGILVNSGLITKVGGNPLSNNMYIQSVVTNTGTMNAGVGNIFFAGPNNSSEVSNIGGVLAGSGTFEFLQGYYNINVTTLSAAHVVFAGSVGSNNITLTSALNYGGNWQQVGGLILVENNLTLSGDTALDGGELKGTATINFAAGSSLHLGTGMDLEGNLSFQMKGPVTQSGALYLGLLSDSVDQVTLAAGNSWLLEGPASISGQYGTITNNGVFGKLDGAQNSIVQSDFINASGGTLLVNSGTLSLAGKGTLGGSVNGSAVLDVSGSFAFAAGLALSVGEFILDGPSALVALYGNVAYANDWASEGGTLNLNGNTLSLTGTASLLYGSFAGQGDVALSGPVLLGSLTEPAFALAQGADMTISGSAEQAGDVVMTSGASAPLLTVTETGSYVLDAGVRLGAAPNNSAAGTLAVLGKLSASQAGTTVIDTNIVLGGTVAGASVAGSISVSYGDMQFLGTVAGSGGITISHGGELDINTSNSFTNAISFGPGGGLLSLASPTDFSGTLNNFISGDAIELQGFGFVTTADLTVSGKSITINEPSGSSLTLTFSNTQSLSTLLIGNGPHGGLALYHL